MLTKSAMKKMATSNVLIVGMKGLGVEIGTLAKSGQAGKEADLFSKEHRSGRCQDRHNLRSQPS